MTRDISYASLLLLTLAGCRDKPETTSLDKVELQLSWSVSPEHAPFILGAEAIFPSYGIDLELAPSRGSNETLSAVAAGRYPIVVASAESLVLARAQGTPIRSVFQFYRESPAVAFTINGYDVRSGPQTLVGKRVGIIRTSTVTTQLSFMLNQAGIPSSDEATPDKVQTVTATQGGTAQLKAGQIDALTHYTNYAPAQFKAQGAPVSELPFRQWGVRSYSAGLVVRDSTIKQDPQLVQRFICAMTESLEAASKDPPAALKAYQKRIQSDAGIYDEGYAKEALERTLRLLNEGLGGKRPGHHDEAGWSTTLQTVRASEKKPFANLKTPDLYTISFTQFAADPKRCSTLKKR